MFRNQREQKKRTITIMVSSESHWPCQFLTKMHKPYIYNFAYTIYKSLNAKNRTFPARFLLCLFSWSLSPLSLFQAPRKNEKAGWGGGGGESPPFFFAPHTDLAFEHLPPLLKKNRKVEGPPSRFFEGRGWSGGCSQAAPRSSWLSHLPSRTG